MNPKYLIFLLSEIEFNCFVFKKFLGCASNFANYNLPKYCTQLEEFRKHMHYIRKNIESIFL